MRLLAILFAMLCWVLDLPEMAAGTSLPVMGIGFANSYESFLLFRLGIGAVGASFVTTHLPVLYGPLWSSSTFA